MNEKTYVEDILANKKIDPAKTFTFLSMYARYLYHEKKMKKSEIISELDKFMQENYPRYNPVDWVDYIDKFASKASKHPLCKCDGIWVTENELKTISEIKNKVLERLAFTILCLAKFNNYRNPSCNNWISYTNGEIYSMACINTTAFEKDIKFWELRERGLIEYAKRVDNLNLQILYIDDESEKKLFVTDFRKLGYEWRLYKGEKYIRCADCGTLVKDNHNHTKRYCNNCAVENRKEYKKTKQREYRMKSVDTIDGKRTS